jgi:GPN-loop GTPase
MLFGGVIVGPPGAGKTTFCDAMQQMFTALARTCAVINLDPANDYFPYPCSIDIRSLIPLNRVMNENSLGPNGGNMILFYSMPTY